jgi:hypothetical protein
MENRNTGASEFTPELLSRRGEFIAWTLSIILLATWALLRLLGQNVFFGLPVLGILMLLAACGISLGNWMDHKTKLSLDADGVHFENGLRKSNLRWDEIYEVYVSPSGWGDKVRVIGEKAHFSFRTLGEVKLQDEVKGRMGFAEGTYILNQIIEKSRLERADTKDSEQSASGIYYTRK